MTLPNFFIIGAPKAGTTALYQYLQLHPEIFMSDPKEPHFFTYQCDRWPEWATPTLEDYQQLFAASNTAKAVGEASTWYLYSQNAAQAIGRLQPQARLIAMLRQPVDRAYASFVFRQQCGWEDIADFTEAIRQESERIAQAQPWDYHYLQAGRYAEQLQRYYDVFPAVQIKVFLYEDFKADAARVLRSICQFLEVSEEDLAHGNKTYNVTQRPKNKRLNNFLSRSSPIKAALKQLIPDRWRQPLANRVRQQNLEKPPQLDPEIRQHLTLRVQDDILKLQGLIDRDLSEWLVS